MRRAEDPIARQALRSVAVLGLASVAAWTMAPHFDRANVILVFMAGIVFVAATSRRWVSLGAIGLSILIFDLIFFAPRWGFAPTRPQDVFTLAVMTGVGLLVTELAARVRREAAEARLRADRLQALNALALQLAAATDADTVARHVRETLAQALGLEARVATGTPAPDTAPGRPGDVTLPAGTVPDEAARGFIAGASAQARLALARLASEARSEAAAVQTEGERLRNTLLSGISHDFRTPLTTIVGVTSSLLEQEGAHDPEARRRLLGSVLREARRLHVLSSTLLDLTRAQEGALEPRFEWCPADELVQAVLRPWQASAPGLVVQVAVAGDPPVWCDPDLIERVLANLLDNAARHVPTGGTVRIDARHGPGRWELRVADDGPGVPPGAEEHIFEKFVQGGDRRDGTGLGLALGAAIARLHGGTLRAHNEGGAVFTLTLPQPRDVPQELER
jgi:two-component system sensor histidine kinase KdpD